MKRGRAPKTPSKRKVPSLSETTTKFLTTIAERWGLWVEWRGDTCVVTTIRSYQAGR